MFYLRAILEQEFCYSMLRCYSMCKRYCAIYIFSIQKYPNKKSLGDRVLGASCSEPYR